MTGRIRTVTIRYGLSRPLPVVHLTPEQEEAETKHIHQRMKDTGCWRQDPREVTSFPEDRGDF